MPRMQRRGFAALAGLAITALALTGCSTASFAMGNADAEESQTAPSADYPITVTDMAGNEVTIESAESVGVFHNQSFGVLESWGVEPSVAARTLMSDRNSWASDDSILDSGSHREPDFETVIAASPDLIINGGRYADHAADLMAASPEAAIIDMSNDELSTQEYVVESVTLLGEIFGEQAAAEELIEQFHAAIDAAVEAYDPAMTVTGLVTSGNEIRYASHVDGRGASVFFELIGMTPALELDGSSNHQGDDISLEAIAQSGADFLLVLDRDAAVSSGAEASPAMDLITGSASLQRLPAVQQGAIHVMPDDYYLTEDIFACITVLEGLTEAFSSAE